VECDIKKNTEGEMSSGQTDSRRQLVQQHHIRRAMSVAELEESEESHTLNLFHGSMSMLFNSNGTNASLVNSSESSSTGKNPKPKSPKTPKSSKNQKCSKKKPKVECLTPQDQCTLSNTSACVNDKWTCVEVFKTCELEGYVCKSLEEQSEC
jgi:hypothetical protein